MYLTYLGRQEVIVTIIPRPSLELGLYFSVVKQIAWIQMHF